MNGGALLALPPSISSHYTNISQTNTNTIPFCVCNTFFTLNTITSTNIAIISTYHWETTKGYSCDLNWGSLLGLVFKFTFHPFLEEHLEFFYRRSIWIFFGRTFYWRSIWMGVGTKQASVFAAWSLVPLASRDPQLNRASQSRAERSDKMYLSKLRNVFVKIAKCVCQNCTNVFVLIAQYI